eukprot:SAG31_NODE_1060_length_10111_cov_17.871354_7_plen_65_part_00
MVLVNISSLAFQLQKELSSHVGAGCNGAHSGGGGSMNNGENQINIHDAGYNNDAGYVNIKCVAE